MTERIAEVTPRTLARVAGVCQLLEALTATYGQVIIPGKLVAPADAAATAANILAHERLFWAGFASSTIGVGFHLAWAFLFYELFKVVNRRLSLYAVFVILVGCAIQALTILFYAAPWGLLHAANFLTAFNPDQLHALTLMFLKLSAQAFDLYLVFFGFWCLLSGWLIFRSTFMPRVLGVLLAISGIGWMVFLSPPFAHSVFFYIGCASAIGEVPLELWMIIAGVNGERWHGQAQRSLRALTGEWAGCRESNLDSGLGGTFSLTSLFIELIEGEKSISRLPRRGRYRTRAERAQCFANWLTAYNAGHNAILVGRLLLCVFQRPPKPVEYVLFV